MRRMTKFHGTIGLLGVLALAVALLPVPVAAQNTAAGPTATAPEAPPAPPENPPAPPQLPPLPVAPSGVMARGFLVHLQEDGSLLGQVSAFDPAGNLFPVSVPIQFVQNGAVVVTAQSDPQGNFRAAGLAPGVYSVIVMDPAGFTAFSVHILPFDPAAPQGQMVLAMTLMPAPDTVLLAQVPGQPMPLPPGAVPMMPGMPMGGGGGGGGGLGGALGLAGLGGLAGLAALADDDEQDFPPASPFQMMDDDEDHD